MNPDEKNFTTVWLPKRLVKELRSMGYEGEAVHRVVRRLVSIAQASEASKLELLRSLLEEVGVENRGI